MKKSLLLIPLACILVSCSKSNITTEKSFASKVEAYESNQLVMVDPFNTSMFLNYYYEDESLPNKDKIDSIYDSTISFLHKEFDRHYDYKIDDNFVTNVKTINDSYGSGQAIKCDTYLYNLIKLAVEYTNISNGYFNLFTGRVTDYWDKCFKEAYDLSTLDTFDPYYNNEQKTLLENYVKEIPNTPNDISNQLTFDDTNLTITFNKLVGQSDEYHPLISVGGIAKGYGTDIVKEELVKNGYTKGILYSGGSSVTLLSDPTWLIKPKQGQKFSVLDPSKNTIFYSEAAFTLSLFEEFNSSTSGNYTTNKHYKIYDENENSITRYHIFSPYTGYSEQYYSSVTCISNKASNAVLDFMTTALMNLSIEDGIKLSDEISKMYPNSWINIYWIDCSSGHSVVHTNDTKNKITLSEGVEIIYEK